MSLPLDKLTDETSLVRSFYNKFPYPSDCLKEGMPLDLDWRYSLKSVYSKFSNKLSTRNYKHQKLRILDAGCGTGVSTNYLAYSNLESEIVAIDISHEALSIAKQRVSKSEANRKSKIEFIEVDLDNFKSDIKFNYINSIGLLNHHKNPLNCLESLKNLLADNGVIHLFVCADIGRHYIKLLQNVFKCLGIQGVKEDIDIARNMIEDLPDNNTLKKNYNKIFKSKMKSDIDFADTFLHPFESSFDLSKLFYFVDEAGLDILGFSDSNHWSLDGFLKGKLLDKAKALPSKDQYKLIEKLDPDMLYFDVFLFEKD
tara:strand:- start:204 stop:1142 length:939 start_codon:yes stop_codon:yes gene_type:complete